MKGELPRNGVGEPTYQELAATGGMTREQLIASGTTQRLDEIYTDTDIRDESDTTGVFLFSYGEYVETIEGINYGPFIKRAEALTRFHLKSINRGSSDEPSLKVIRREWLHATNPDIAVVHIYVQE